MHRMKNLLIATSLVALAASSAVADCYNPDAGGGNDLGPLRVQSDTIVEHPVLSPGRALHLSSGAAVRRGLDDSGDPLQ